LATSAANLMPVLATCAVLSIPADHAKVAAIINLRKPFVVKIARQTYRID